MNNTETMNCKMDFQQYVGFVSRSFCTSEKEIEVVVYEEQPILLINDIKETFIDSLIKFINFKSLLIDVS